MSIITHSQRYLPHEINTKYHAVKLYRSGVGIAFVCRRYKIFKSSLMRWNRHFDGTKESLMDKYHKSYSVHLNTHTEQELKWIKSYHRRNPHIQIGVKWQMDVKYVPKACYTKQVLDKFYQYTVIDEASRERFIYPYKEQSSYSTIDFLKRVVTYFGYKPQILQTNNDL